MSWAQALIYFLSEAVVSIRRSFRVSSIAILTIAVSLFLAGALFLASENLERTVKEWRSRARIVVYLESEGSSEVAAQIGQVVRSAPWGARVVEVPPEEAERRFTEAFPSLSGLVDNPDDRVGLPLSFEIEIAPSAELATVASDLATWRALAGVAFVDDDRDWIAEVETLLAVVRGIGVALAAILLGASSFTIASVVRLTCLLYREEIAVQRLVGATEFYLRGPFYFEGVLQGALGGAIAVGALWVAHLLARPRLGESFLASLVAGRFLAPGQLLLLVALGAIAGLVGAIVSLGRESWGESPSS